MDNYQIIRTIANRLREERLRAKLTQPALALIGGVSKTTQSGYESALHAPDALYLSRIDNHGLDSAFIVTGQLSAVSAGAKLNWDLLAELIGVLDIFEQKKGTTLDAKMKARLLRVLYAASIAEGRVDPAITSTLLIYAA